MLDNFDFGVIASSWRYLFLEGMVFTISLTVIAAILGLLLGTAIALIRLANIPVLSTAARLFVNLMRALPLVLVIFWFYLSAPFVVQWITGSPRPVLLDSFTLSVITFSLFEAAYFAEIMRAGIESVSKGQRSAASALGLTYRQSMNNIILPQAFRNMLPVMLLQTIVLFQDTSLVYVLSLTDFLGAASKIAQRDGRFVEMYLLAAVVYFVICFAASRGVGLIQNKIRVLR